MDDHLYDAGERLQRERIALGLTAEQFASGLEISRGYLSALENNKKPLSKKVLSALDRVYGIDRQRLEKGDARQRSQVDSGARGRRERDLAPVAGKQVVKSHMSVIHAVTTAGDGSDFPSHAALARDAPPPWLLAVRPDTTQAGGAAASELPSRALLPATGEGAQSRLVLSLDLGDPQQPTTVSYEVLPRIVDAAAAGRGAPVGTGQKDLIGDMAFSFAWLRQNLGHTSGNVATVSVVGDSMAPTLLDGDTIIVDCDVREVQADAIYVLDLYGARLVKRVRMLRATGGLELISDNSRYQPEVIPRDVARDLVVVGRMVWPRVR